MKSDGILQLISNLDDTYPEKRELLKEYYNANNKALASAPNGFMEERQKLLDEFMELRKKYSSAEAEFKHYKALIQLELHPLIRDIISGELMTLFEGRWVNVYTMVPFLKSIIRDLPGYKVGAVEDHLARMIPEYKPDFLIDIPEWDKKDRIKEMVRCLKLDVLDIESVEELTKEFCSKIFERAYDSTIENFTLILKGVQGCGKDSWLRQFFSGFGSYFAPLTVTRDIKDFELALTDNFILNVPEYERLLLLGDDIIKDSISKPSTKVRRPYDRVAVDRPNQSTLVGSTNKYDIFQDESGCRRYLFFDIKRIDWSYPKSREHGKQLAAQMFSLSQEKYRAKEVHHEKMAKYLETFSAIDMEGVLMENYTIFIKKYNIGKKHEFTLDEIRFILEDLSKITGFTQKKIQNIFNRRGITRHTRDGRRYMNPNML